MIQDRYCHEMLIVRGTPGTPDVVYRRCDKPAKFKIGQLKDGEFEYEWFCADHCDRRIALAEPIRIDLVPARGCTPRH